jgi:hypothetical protein
MTMATRFRQQAQACAELGSPMYADLLGRCAHDIAEGGVIAAVLAGHEDDPGPSGLALRLAGSVHRLVLEGRAGELASYFPSVGGRWDPDRGWRAFQTLLGDAPEVVREWLDRPPQTNEVGRAGALLGGLLRVPESARLPVRLLEIGSSGGLNLRADRFCCTDEHGRRWGDPDSPVVLEGAWRGADPVPWPDLAIVERLGSDVMPVDPTTPEGRLVLTSYVWPDQDARLARLRAALDIAATCPAEVRRTDARSFVDGIELVPGRLTVLWHSVMWQYLTADDRAAIDARIEAIVATAQDDLPFAHLLLEPLRRTPRDEHQFLVVLQVWPTGERRVLGTSVGHGIPTTWE